MAKLFGTDGIRGEVGTFLTAELALEIGRSAAKVLRNTNNHSPKILIGRDTRLSGPMLEAALSAGMCSLGADIYITGILPTPSIAYLVKKHNFDAGVVISASHNMYKDNGIKFFNSNGYKLADDIENEIEENLTITNEYTNEIGNIHQFEDAETDYIAFLKHTMDNIDLHGYTIAVDCANGATSKVAPRVLQELGANVLLIHHQPNGKNINFKCGSTHIDSLVEFVKETKADIGLAFDGDGDRCILVDENGKTVNGDEIMSIVSNFLKENGKLAKNTLVATIMSNLGLFIMGNKKGIHVEKTAVGDRYVLETMIEKGCNFGGEQSGHLIFLDYTTTGDGILTALQILKIMRIKNKLLSELNTQMSLLPQVLVGANVDPSKKNSFLENPIIKKEIEKLERKMGEDSRVLIRPSGTEALIRVMIEGTDIDLITNEAEKMASFIEKNI